VFVVGVEVEAELRVLFLVLIFVSLKEKVCVSVILYG
jgi:hypothetical protein